jgi:hypothetical protein
MGMARYAFRVGGPASDAVLTASREGLEAEVGRAGTALRCWLPATHRNQTQSSRPIAA